MQEKFENQPFYGRAPCNVERPRVRTTRSLSFPGSCCEKTLIWTHSIATIIFPSLTFRAARADLATRDRNGANASERWQPDSLLLPLLPSGLRSLNNKLYFTTYLQCTLLSVRAAGNHPCHTFHLFCIHITAPTRPWRWPTLRSCSASVRAPPCQRPRISALV